MNVYLLLCHGASQLREVFVGAKTIRDLLLVSVSGVKGVMRLKAEDKACTGNVRRESASHEISPESQSTWRILCKWKRYRTDYNLYNFRLRGGVKGKVT